jgi:hypothetical protein
LLEISVVALSQQRELLKHLNRSFLRCQYKAKKDEVLRSEQPFLPMGQILAFTQSTLNESNCSYLIVLTMPGQSV